MLANLALSENGFLFDTQTGFTYTLNLTGAFLLRALIDGTPPSQLVQRLTDAFDVSEALAQNDVTLFTQRLEALGILEKAEPGA
ncbi:MAG: PqqD family protein [Myxococcales bacterium]|jgi:hypothetical protein|nr:PqqD family protein [Myxococcales bacterium]